MIRACAGAPGAQQPTVQRGVHDEHQDPEHELRLNGEALWIQGRKHVASDEVARVLVEAGAPTQLVLEGRERANPTGDFHIRPPGSGGQVDPCQPRPAEDQQPASHDENRERHVADDEQGGQDAEWIHVRVAFTASTATGAA